MFGFSWGSKTARGNQVSAPEVPPQRQRRAFAGVRSAVRSLFNGASTDRMTASWGTTPLPADQVIEKVQRVLVARSREQASNNDYAKAFLRMCRQNIVGPQGVALTAKNMTAGGKLDRTTNEAVEWAFFEWSKPENCDVKGKRSLRAMANTVVNSAAKDGEYMVRLVWGEDAGPWGFALQTLDPQRCPVDMKDDRPLGGGFIRHGIHFNQYGRATAYYFTTTNESEADYWYGGKAFIKVPAEEILHDFEEDMVGQKRGLPWLATSLFRMRHLNGMEDAAVINARVGAAKMGVIQWKEGEGPECMDVQDEEDVPQISAEAGEFLTLPTGAEFVKWDPQYPSGEFAPFTKYILRSMAAGMGVPYNELAADLEGVNFSSIRQGTLDSRESWKDKQQWLIEGFYQRVFDAWLPRALLAGRIKVRGKSVSAVNPAKYSTVEWQGRRWDWIDPNADMKAAEGRKNNLLASPSSIIREQGKDPLAVWTETARDMRDMVDAIIAAGFPADKAQEMVLLSMGRQPDKPLPPAADKKEANEAA